MALDVLDLADDDIQGLCHTLMNVFGIITFNEIGFISVSLEELTQLLFGDTCQHGRIGDLVAVEVQNRKHGAVMNRVEKFVRMPTGSQGASFRFAITHHAGYQQIGVVESSAKGMGQRIAQFTSFMDGARRLRRHVAGDAPGKGKLLEQSLHSRFVLGDVGVQLGVDTFQVSIGHQTRPSVARPGDKNHVQVILIDDAIEMNIDKV